MTVVLQRSSDEITLDDALLSMSTFPNGCDFRLRFDGDRVYVEYGCYGVHRNLAQGPKRLLMNWIDADGPGGWRVVNDVDPETILELKKRLPCPKCGGFQFKAEK